MSEHNHRARELFAHAARYVAYSAKLGPRHLLGALRHPWVLPRPGYCQRCGGWAWLTLEQAAYSTATGMLCHECADYNEEALEECYRNVYGRVG
jgi:hypothetical protein